MMFGDCDIAAQMNQPASSFRRRPEPSAFPDAKHLNSGPAGRVTTWVPDRAGATVMVTR